MLLQGKISVKQLDLADLASVKALGAELAAAPQRLDLLILNAGRAGILLAGGLLGSPASALGCAAVRMARHPRRRACGPTAAASLPRPTPAGVMACPLGRTQQGFETQIGTNHLGHAYLAQLLLPKMEAQVGGLRAAGLAGLG